MFWFVYFLNCSGKVQRVFAQVLATVFVLEPDRMRGEGRLLGVPSSVSARPLPTGNKKYENARLGSRIPEWIACTLCKQLKWSTPALFKKRRK